MKQKSENKRIGDLTIREYKNLIANILANYQPQSTKPDPDELVPRLDVAKEFKVSCITLDRWVRLEVFPSSIKVGGRLFFKRSQIDSFLTSKQKKL
jgi:predicted DNA-binding transcriptional regulator AlpA